MNKLKTIAIVVTHNRINLLKRCLENLQIQTLKVDKVLVIDNGSSDGTQAFLDSIGIEYIRQPNLGSAGGWYTGLKYALRKRFDTAWLMDDDGYPHKDAYRLLKSAFKKNQNSFPIILDSFCNEYRKALSLINETKEFDSIVLSGGKLKELKFVKTFFSNLDGYRIQFRSRNEIDETLIGLHKLSSL